MNKKVAVIIVVIVLAMAGYFGYNYFVKDNAKAETTGGAPKLEELKTYSAGEAFVTNVKDSKALCKLSASVAYSGEDQSESMAEHNALIRSCILEVIRNHTESELTAPDAPQMLGKKMVSVLNEKLETDSIVNVYISDYVVQ